MTEKQKEKRSKFINKRKEIWNKNIQAIQLYHKIIMVHSVWDKSNKNIVSSKSIVKKLI